MRAQLCIFEDNFYSRFFPLVYFRPVFNLKCGVLSLKEKIQHSYRGVRTSIQCREYLVDYMRVRNPGVPVNEITSSSCLFINGRVLADDRLAKQIAPDGGPDTLYIKGDQIVAARVSGPLLLKIKKMSSDVFSIADFDGLPVRGVDVPLITYPWDLVNNNGSQLRADISRMMKRKAAKGSRSAAHRGVSFVNPKSIFVGEGTVIKPGVVIDAEDGPVYIGRNVRIMSQSTIIGPASIGDGSIVKVGAKIYEDTSIGPVCKVGGEVEASIIHGYSNKQHDGFLGHAYLGTWVNLGAGTTNSDLKNNYGPVKVFINGEAVDSGTQFVGVTIGDHSKTAINSMFNTGTVIGVSSNIFGSGFPPKYVPSFSWGAAGETFTTYSIDRAIDVARRVMARRKMVLTDAEVLLFKKIFDLTSDERRQRGMPA